MCVRWKQCQVCQDNVQKSCNHFPDGKNLYVFILLKIFCVFVYLINSLLSIFPFTSSLPYSDTGQMAAQHHLLRWKINWIQWRPMLLKFLYVGPHTPVIEKSGTEYGMVFLIVEKGISKTNFQLKYSYYSWLRMSDFFTSMKWPTPNSMNSRKGLSHLGAGFKGRFSYLMGWAARQP